MRKITSFIKSIYDYLTKPASELEPKNNAIKTYHHTKPDYDGLESLAQSTAKRRYDLIPMEALRAVAELQSFAVKKYGFETWRKVPMRDHYNHAFAHLYDAFVEDTTEETVKDNLVHAVNRIMFIIDQLDD